MCIRDRFPEVSRRASSSFAAGSIPLVPKEFWAAYPKLVALHKRVVAVPSLRAYLDSERRYPFPEGDIGVAYVANVNTVLDR